MATLGKAGRYELLQEIGRGAMGVVYRAHDPVIGRTVAVKTMRLAGHGSGLTQEELLRRFQTEARAAGLLSHPNIVSVYDAGNEDDLFYITMELVEGKSLQDLLGPRNAFPVVRVMRLMQQACSALEFAHRHNVVHRDIKPANLILTSDDTLKISDFGTAKILQFGAHQTGQIVGTPSYMSPEQIKGRPVDGRSDIFSLGGVLYELLTGQKAFSGDSITAVIYKIVSEEPSAPRDLDPSIHMGLSAVALKALAKSPHARFQSCVEFFDALQNHRDYQPSVASASASAAKTSMEINQADDTAVSTDALAETAAPWASAPEKQGGSAWVVALLLVIIAGAGYKVWPPLWDLWLRAQPPLSAGIPAELTSEERAARVQTPAETEASSNPEPVGAKQSSVPLVPPQVSSASTPIRAAAPVDEVAVPRAPVPPDSAAEPSRQASSGPVLPQQASPAVTQTAAPTQSPSPQPAAAPVAVRPRAAVPPVSPVALLWRDRIAQMLAETGNSQRARVVATGRTLTLVGKLDSQSYRRLLDVTKGAPEEVQIVDHIEMEAPPAENVRGDDTSLMPAPGETEPKPPASELGR
jgi:serine/threonine-protein kinase